MSELSQAESYLLEQVRQGSESAWAQLLQRYEGRLLAFAQTKLNRRVDAEDIIQETFIGFLKGLENFRGQASLETYLFTILRRKIIDCYRSRRSRELCLIQDHFNSPDSNGNVSDAFKYLPSTEQSASWYARRDEQHGQQSLTLAQALRELVNGFKESLNFRDLQIIELLFYCQIANKDAAAITDVSEKNIAVIKHRCLKQVRQCVWKSPATPDEATISENLLSELWESLRLSCPKRSTIGGYLLETLDKPWQDYVDFHLNRLGCHFCRANLTDLQQQNSAHEQVDFRERIMQSTVGFLHKR